jgi:DNA repair photolyase
MTTPDEDVRRLVEPFCSSNAERLELLGDAKDAGFVPYAMLGPLLPGISDSTDRIEQLVAMVAASGVHYIYYDTLNPRWGVWPTYRAFLRESFPELIDRTRAALFDKEARAAYADALDRNVQAAAARHGLRTGG